MTRNMKLGIAAGFLITLGLGYYLGQGSAPVAAPHPMQSFVNCADNQPVFRPRTIVLGRANGDTYAIEKGLATGEEVAVNGVFAIDAAAQLGGGRSMMSSGRQPEAPVAAQH